GADAVKGGALRAHADGDGAGLVCFGGRLGGGADGGVFGTQGVRGLAAALAERCVHVLRQAAGASGAAPVLGLAVLAHGAVLAEKAVPAAPLARAVVVVGGRVLAVGVGDGLRFGPVAGFGLDARAARAGADAGRADGPAAVGEVASGLLVVAEVAASGEVRVHGGCSLRCRVSSGGCARPRVGRAGPARRC